MRRSHQSLLLALAALTTVPIMTGCVRRRLTVRTSPPGALISVDNQIIGTSPAASSFIYYGSREIRAELDGYRTETIVRRLNPPWYEYPGLDFIAETLWPFEIRDERIIDIEMIPQEIAPTQDIISRAGALREQSQQGVIPAPSISVTPPTIISSPSDLPTPIPTPASQLPPGGIPLP